MNTADADHGRTHIEDAVVAKIASMATREVSGVHSLGGGTRNPSLSLTEGVSVEVGEAEAAVDIAIVAEYGVAIHELAVAIRRNVMSAIERMTGLVVTEVNITIHDIFLELDEEFVEDSVPRVK